MRRTHHSLREGLTLGFMVATSIWLWLVIVDAIAGQPFRTFHVLGGIALFTVLHYLLCLAYGVAAVAVVHRAAREPSLIMAAAFGFFVISFAFAMLSALLSQVGLGQLAWVRILGGNVVGGMLTFILLSRTHPVLETFKEAEQEE